MSLRAHLDDFIAADFSNLPSSLDAIVDTLDGVTLSSNNFLDPVIDVFDFVKDVEIVGRIMDSSFEVSTDVGVLEDYLAANDPAYFSTYLNQIAAIQGRINGILSFEPGGFANFSSNFGLLYEGITGIGSALLSGLSAAKSSVTSAAGNASAAYNAITSDDFLLIGKALFQTDANGISAADVLRLKTFTEAFLSVVTKGLTSLGTSDVGDAGSADFDDYFTEVNAFIQLYNDLSDIFDSLGSIPVIAVISDMIAICVEIVDFKDDLDALGNIQGNPELSALSLDFLSDARIANWLELGDIIANIGQLAVKLAAAVAQPQFAVLAAYVSEGVRTATDLASVYYKGKWIKDDARFDAYRALVGEIDDYQNVLTSALSRADTAHGITWGTSITSVIPTEPLPSGDVFARLYDRNSEAGESGTGNTLTTTGVSATGDLSVFADDGDWYRVDLTEGVDYRIAITGSDISSLDLLLYAPTAQLLAEESLPLSNSSTRVMEGTASQTGTHFIVVEGGRDFSITVTEINFTTDFTELAEAAPTTDTLHSLAVGENFGGMITGHEFFDSAYREDWIRIDLSAGEHYRVTLDKLGATYGALYLYDEQGRWMGIHDEDLSTSTSLLLEGTAQRSGTYFVGVSGSQTAYTLSLDAAVFDTDIVEFEDAAGDRTTAYNLSVGQSLRGEKFAFNSQFDHADWVRLELDAGAVYRIALDGYGELELYDSYGLQIAYENASLSGGQVSVIEGTVLTSGTYYAGVTGGSAGSYVVSLDTVIPQETLTEFLDTPGTIETPISLSPGQSFHGNMNFDDQDSSDGDWIKVELSAGENYRIVLEEETNSNARVRLYDATGLLVGEPNSAISNNTTSIIEGTATVSGTYFVAAESGNSGSYTVRFDTYSPAEDRVELWDAAGSALTTYALETGQTFRGNMNYRDEDYTSADWIAVTLQAGQSYAVLATEDSITSLSAHLYNAAGDLLADPDVSTNSTSGFTYTAATAGTYYIAIESNFSGSYTIAFDYALNEISGGASDDTVNGTSAADVLRGLDGADTLNGYRGDDTFFGGAGDDTFHGGSGTDEVVYDTDVGVNVYLKWSGTQTNAGRDVFDSIENLRGSEHDDRLIGNAQNNNLTGGSGDDILKGKGGRDVLRGEDGNDFLRTEEGDDILLGGSGSDTLVGLSGDDILFGGSGDDYAYGGRDADVITGNDGDDRLRGNLGTDELFGGNGIDRLYGGGSGDLLKGGAGNDFVLGEGGNDTVFGGSGDDVLTGGTGSDNFVFVTGQFGVDRIKDFQQGQDRIDVTDMGYVLFSQVLAGSKDTNIGARLELNGQTVYLEGIDLGTLSASDFLF